jgi:malonyl-CoA/methylmalonyl-CoA synthetase
MSDSLYAHLSACFPRDPEQPFIETARRRIITYGELDALCGRVACTLAALGVRPGDRVAVHTEKSPEALILYLGTIRAGAVYLPLNIGYTPAELSYFVSDAEPSLVVCDPAEEEPVRSLAAMAGGAAVETLGRAQDGSLWPKVMAAPPDIAPAPREADDLAAILYTSGTTGRSKGAMLTQRNLASNAETLRDYWRFAAEDRLLHALPIFHAHGLFVATNVVLMAGASMLFLERFDLDEIMRLLPQATAMMGVPTFYSRLLTRPDLTAETVRHVRLFVSGSAPLSAETHREFAARTGHAILERYGMTETNMITSNPYMGERRAGTVGLPLPGVEVRIADRETGRPMPQGEVGVIEVRGPNVFKGYWRNPEKTRAEFRPDGFFITGDLGFEDASRYIHIVGRDKDLIITGGFNVYPAEIEGAIDAVPGVAESAVIGLPHPDLGEGVTAVVVKRPGASLTESDIEAALKDQLARFKQPKRVIFLEGLPRNAMGKVQKVALREQFADAYTKGQA